MKMKVEIKIPVAKKCKDIPCAADIEVVTLKSCKNEGYIVLELEGNVYHIELKALAEAVALLC